MSALRTRLAITVALVAILLVALVPFVAGPADAALGAQPAPTLNPDPVATATALFTLSVPGNVFCEGTGANGWRAHTFIVNDGVDVSTLDFTLPGLPPGYVGTDFDSVGDGTIAAPLHAGTDAGVNLIPGATPAGLIDPSKLAGFTFDPSFWHLADGPYQIGFVCVDGPGIVRQWWSRSVTIDADASPNPFLVATSEPPTTTTTQGPTTTTTQGPTTTTTQPTTQPTTTTTSTTASSFPSGAGAGTGTTPATGSSLLSTGLLSTGTSGSGGGGSALPRTGIELHHAALGLVLIYVGRMLYLLGRPRRSATRS